MIRGNSAPNFLVPPVDRRTLRTPDPYVYHIIIIIIDLNRQQHPWSSGIGSVLEPEVPMFRSDMMKIESDLNLWFINALRSIKLHSLDYLSCHFLTHSSYYILRYSDEIDISKYIRDESLMIDKI